VNGRTVEVRNLHHTYFVDTPFSTRTLRGISFHVNPGERVGLIGPTGSGKSTLLQHLNGLIRPQSGDVIVGGVSLADRGVDVRRVRRAVGLVLQTPESQLFERFVGDDVAYAPRNLGLDRGETRRRVRDALAQVGLDFSFKDRETRGLSAGEKRRVAIAGVLAMDPEVLLLDEPTANLDPSGRRTLLSLLARWTRSRARSLVLVSHDMEDVLTLCDRAYLLAEGKILVEDRVPAFFSSHTGLFDELGLALPFVTRVMREISRFAPGVDTGVRDLEEAAAVIGGLIGER
jgi:energy-coupling factor transport system ATP-binding protein